MPTTSAGSDDVSRAIRALEEEFARHANARDTASLTEAYYAEEARILPPNAPPATGKAAIRNFWRAFLVFGGTDVTLETEQVYSSGDLAYSIGKYGMTRAGAREHGKYMAVYRRQADGGYKAVADMFSSNT